MKSIFWIFSIFVLLTGLTINFNYNIYAQKSSFNKQNTNFNIAVAADWGCDENAEKTAQNIQSKNPEVVIANGDLSYSESSECWLGIIQPFKSKMMIAMGDHDYSDTSGGAIGIINQYLKPLNLPKTYYSFDINNVHVTIIDPYIDYNPGSAQYQFIENDLKTASTNSNIDWIFAVESKPLYTSPSKHDADPAIRNTYHPLFDRYNVDLVLSSDNHNYQRTFPLKHNSQQGGASSNPIITDSNQNNYNGDYEGQIYLITGTAGRSHYDLEGQAPFVVKQNDDDYGFLNIDINTNNTSLTGTFYSNGNDETLNNNMNENNNVIDQFTISKVN
jgi:calcineurin-like phosphoesterase family protein/iron/zinc purple acid phosphatase-like protein C